MSIPRVLLVEDTIFHRVAPFAINHIKSALEAEGCQAHVIRESKMLSFQPSTFDLIARRSLKELIETPSDITVAAGSRAQRLLKKIRRDFRSWWPEAEVEPGIPMPLIETPRTIKHPPQALGICSEIPTTQRAAQLVAEELDLLLVDLKSHPSPADISLHSNQASQSHLHALDLILCDRPAEDLPALRGALYGVAVMGPGVCNEEPFDPDSIDAWRSKSRQLLEDPALRLSHAEAWSTSMTKRHDPRTIAQRLLGRLPLLQPKMN